MEPIEIEGIMVQQLTIDQLENYVQMRIKMDRADRLQDGYINKEEAMKMLNCNDNYLQNLRNGGKIAYSQPPALDLDGKIKKDENGNIILGKIFHYSRSSIIKYKNEYLINKDKI